MYNHKYKYNHSPPAPLQIAGRTCLSLRQRAGRPADPAGSLPCGSPACLENKSYYYIYIVYCMLQSSNSGAKTSYYVEELGSLEFLQICVSLTMFTRFNNKLILILKLQCLFESDPFK